MDIQLNELSKKEFDPALINEITPDTTRFGRRKIRLEELILE